VAVRTDHILRYLNAVEPDKKLRFCAECVEFPCMVLKCSVGVHPNWLEDLAKLPSKSIVTNGKSSLTIIFKDLFCKKAKGERGASCLFLANCQQAFLGV
jgi:hypothetical protein